MHYVGMQAQQRRNNLLSMLLLVLFPLIICAMVWLFCYATAELSYSNDSYYFDESHPVSAFTLANENTLMALPWVGIIVTAWFFIAYMTNTAMIRKATGARSLERRENPRVYNIVENLTMNCGMPMPKINVIDSPELNAFASGIDNNSYTVTVTTGLCDTLTYDELEGVIAHELTHIRNRDTRLLIVSIVFVGIMSTIMTLAWRLCWNTIIHGGGRSRRSNNNDNDKSGVAFIVMLAIAAVLAAVGYVFTLLTRFAISRKREFMADAGGAELCGNPLGLASALRKISANPLPAPEGRDDVAQLYIVHQSLAGEILSFFSSIFSTHPDTKERIRILEQF